MVAKLAGLPRAWRAMGNILNENPEAEPSVRYGAGKDSKIPCHRVIRLGGEVGGYRKGVKNKIALLKKERLMVRGKKVI